MSPITASQLRGNWATLLLPLNADESIDYGLLDAEIDHFVSARVDGIYSNGSAGEFYAQSEEEFDRISGLLAEKCTRAGMPFQIGVSHMSPQLSRSRLRRAKALRPSGVQVILPDWFVPTWAEIVDFLRDLAAEADPVPLILYSPPHAKRQITPEEWRGLTEAVPGLVGAKVAGGDDAWFAAMQPVFARISVFIPGHLLGAGLARGAHGAYSNVACLSPGGAQRWYELCVRDPEAGRLQQEKLLSFWLGQVAPLITRDRLCNMAVDKAVAAAGGWLPGFSARIRWPYRGASPEMVRAIADSARAALPEFFRDAR